MIYIYSHMFKEVHPLGGKSQGSYHQTRRLNWLNCWKIWTDQENVLGMAGTRYPNKHLSPYTHWIKLIDPWLAPPMLLSPPISHLAPGDLKFPVFSIPFSRSFLLEYSCSRFTASLVHLLQLPWAQTPEVMNEDTTQQTISFSVNFKGVILDIVLPQPAGKARLTCGTVKSQVCCTEKYVPIG